MNTKWKWLRRTRVKSDQKVYPADYLSYLLFVLMALALAGVVAGVFLF
jgi:hypothetical protein